jgi:hypothetical protein
MNKLFFFPHTKSREEKVCLVVKLLKPTPSMRIVNVGASGPNFAFAEQFESAYKRPHSSYRRWHFLVRSAGLQTSLFRGCAGLQRLCAALS